MSRGWNRSGHNYKRARDANEPEIVEALEKHGATVWRLDTPVDLLVGGQLVARGELVAIDTQLGLRIVEIVAEDGADED